MIRIVTLNTNRSEYDIRDAADCSITVGELIDELESNYNRDDKIVFSNDNGYTYGYVGAGYIDEHTVESKEEEEAREKAEELRNDMEMLQEDLTDLQAEYENPDDPEERMSDEDYEAERERLFKLYDITEEQYNNFEF